MSSAPTFRLEKHPKKKGTCPSCNTPRAWRYYEDGEGKRLDERFGICDRANKCGYQVLPDGQALRSTAAIADEPIETVLPDATLSTTLLEKVKDLSSTFHKWCNRLLIHGDHLQRWRVGTDGDRTIFVHLNQHGQVVNAKWFRYQPDGRRDKATEPFTLKQPPKSAKQRFGQCLYGIHLLRAPDQLVPVCVVESEKTAVLASHYYPQFDWVACGAANGITDEKIGALVGRKVWWICDADGNQPHPTLKGRTTEGGRRNSSIRKLSTWGIEHEIIDLFPDRHDGYDLGDAIRDGVRPDIVPPPKPKPKAPEIVGVDDEALEEGAVEDLKMRLPEGVDPRDVVRYGFYAYKNSYYFENNGGFQRISNFTLSVRFLIRSKTDPKRICELKNFYGQKALIDLPVASLVSLEKFKIAVESEGNFLFEGSPAQLARIKRKLFTEELPSTEISPLGWQPEAGVYAWANGIYNGQFTEADDFGIVKHNGKNYYIPVFSRIHADDHETYANERKFIYKRAGVTFAQWAALFKKVYGNNAMVAIPFYVAAIFRDIVYRRLNFFPILNLFGSPGSGKSTLAYSLMSLFGETQDPYMLSGAGTPKAFMRKFSQLRNAMVWLDEYRNNIGDQKIESLKNIYDGTGYERAMMTQDNRTKTTPVHSACILSGQELPTLTPALFKRTLLLSFRIDDWDVAAFDELKRHQLNGLSSVTCEVCKYRSMVEKEFNGAFDTAFTELKAGGGPGIEDRLLKNSAVTLAMVKILGEAMEMPFTYAQALDYHTATTRSQAKLISTSQETAKFWQIVEFLLEQRQITADGDFRIVGGEDRQLYLRFTKIHPLYLEYHNRQHGTKGLDRTSLLHYLEADPAFIEVKKSARFKDANSSCHVFDYKKLGVNLERTEHLGPLPAEQLVATKEPDSGIGRQPDTVPPPF